MHFLPPSLLTICQFSSPFACVQLQYRILFVRVLCALQLGPRRISGIMDTCEKTKDSDGLTSGVTQPLHIDMHIHQESVLPKLLLSACSHLQSKIQPKCTTIHSQGRKRLLVASWVTQIVLGVLSGVLGGFLYICKYSALLSSGAAIWTGAVSVLAGATAFLKEKRGGRCWRFLRTLLALTAFSTAVAAIKIGADYLYWVPFNDGDYICSDPSRQRWPTPPPSTMSPEEDRRLHLCLAYMDMLVALFRGLQFTLLGIWVLLLVASLAPLAPLVCMCLCCWRRLLAEEEKNQKEQLEVECSPISA
ncbi:PREDICTED: transmembrane protein 176A [Elephantulus edwardii]|uniref:transmembrane protein 176A n=1 Tax=Elephantulus edwardii TaxID=28737 RepID=UPI0003F0DFB7|nr:PREDICTED: transmembrane protein 176A [Elephantulus edwardii]